jgi:hypothetical protein
MNNTITLKKVVNHPLFGLVCFVALYFILPRYGAVAMIGCAAVLSACVAANPERFRSRSGSLTTAVCFLTAMWVAAAVFSVLSWIGWLID